VADGGSYARTLNSLSGQTVGAIAAARYSASHSFVTTMLDGCPTYEQAGITDAEEGCGWARIIGRQTDQNATGDALGYQGRCLDHADRRAGADRAQLVPRRFHRL
jgi:hypothetical protein